MARISIVGSLPNVALKLLNSASSFLIRAGEDMVSPYFLQFCWGNPLRRISEKTSDSGFFWPCSTAHLSAAAIFIPALQVVARRARRTFWAALIIEFSAAIKTKCHSYPKLTSKCQPLYSISDLSFSIVPLSPLAILSE